MSLVIVSVHGHDHLWLDGLFVSPQNFQVEGLSGHANHNHPVEQIRFRASHRDRVKAYSYMYNT